MTGISARALLVLAATLATTRLFAFPSSRLVYARGEGAESCPAEAAARRAVAMRLGYDPFFPSADKTVIAEIVRDRGELRGRVAMVDEQGLFQGAREFRMPVALCDELVATMALAISIAIDPTSETVATNQTTAATQPEPAPPEAAEAPVPQKAKVPEQSPARDARPPMSVRSSQTLPTPTTSAPLEPQAGLSVTSSFGTAPSPAFGVGGALALRWGRFSLAVEGRGDWPASGDVPTGGAVSASLWAGGLVPCFHVDPWFVCAVAAYGRVRGSGDRLLTPRSEQTRYGAAGGRAGVALRLWGPVWFRPQVDLLANLARVELWVDGGQVWTAPPVSLLFGAGILVSFP
jgi:hypothetical protein